jgi:CHAD domain-containing protein
MLANLRERELKLAVNATFIVPDLIDPALGVLELRDLPELDLVSTYHDTPDLRLARAGVTLRYRTGDQGGPVWTLKLRVAGSDGSVRDELTFPGEPGAIPVAALDLVTALSRACALEPVATLRTRRRRWLLCGGAERELAELVDDEVTVLDGEEVRARFRELELESRGPDLDQLIPIAERLQLAGAVLAEPVPKVVRAMGPRAAAPADLAPVEVQPSDPAGRAVQAAIAAGAIRLTQNDPATRLGEAEPLHQMRVATRRMRSDLRTFAPLVDPAWASGLAEELGWLGGCLGAVRDLDVQIAQLEALADDLRPDLGPIFDPLGEQRETARSALMRELRSSRYTALLDRLVNASRVPSLTAAAEAPVEEALPPLLHTAWRRLARQARTITPDDPDERYHAVRILAKRARYAAEAIGPVLAGGGKRELLFGAGAAALQDLLGSLQDAVIGADLIHQHAAGSDDPRFSMAAGRLYEREQLVRARARAGYLDLWRRLARRGARLSGGA